VATYIIDTTKATGGGTYNSYSDLIAAISNLAAGDIVKWHAPTGNEHPAVTLGDAGAVDNPIIHFSVDSSYDYQPCGAIIDAASASNYGIYTTQSDLVMRGFKIKNANNSGIYTSGFRTVIDQCCIHDCNGYGIRGLRTTNIYSRNRIYNTVTYGIFVNWSGWVLYNEISDCERPIQDGHVIIGNTIYDYTVQAVFLEATSGAVFVGNTVAYGGVGSIGVDLRNQVVFTAFNKFVSVPSAFTVTAGAFASTALNNAFFDVTTKYTNTVRKIGDDIDLTSDEFVDGAARDLRPDGEDSINIAIAAGDSSNIGYYSAGLPKQVVEADYPAITDVRDGVDYSNGDLTGTLDLPAEADVKLGVQYDNTTKTGTYALPQGLRRQRMEQFYSEEYA
jgi:hypothetical protein